MHCHLKVLGPLRSSLHERGTLFHPFYQKEEDIEIDEDRILGSSSSNLGLYSLLVCPLRLI